MADAKPGDMQPGDFSFRVSCYEQLHFSPDDVSRLPLGEAEKLAIYFSETAKKQWEDRRDSNKNSPSSGDGSGHKYLVEQTFGGDGRYGDEE